MILIDIIHVVHQLHIFFIYIERGVGAFTHVYGVRSSHFQCGSRSVVRKCLQSLEKSTSGDRVITQLRRRNMVTIAKQIAEKLDR